MNPLLKHLHPYPFERLRELFSGVSPSARHGAINLSIGEPKHATPALIQEALSGALAGLASYPSTVGSESLRTAISAWIERRYGGIRLNPATEVLPVLGTREGLFSIAQAVIDGRSSGAPPYVVCPNPFYQIYEGAALLAGARPFYVPALAGHGFQVDYASVPEEVWASTALVYTCSPGNPTGAVMTLEEWAHLFDLADRFGFAIASDECYSEIYLDEAKPPLGALEAAHRLGRTHFKHLLVFSSLSKRSNVPGLRSGFVAGDAELIRSFLLYRTYHGSAMSPVVQAASVAAWNDEAHVLENRRLYREKFAAVTPILAAAMDVGLPEAGFYLWAKTPGDDTSFVRELLRQYNVTVLPGSYLAREQNGFNPGAGRIRIALVASLDECVQAAHRIADLTTSLSSSSS